MNAQNDIPQDDELEGFETFEDDVAEDPVSEADEAIDDADFQDISDDVDEDVFGEEEPAPAPKKKSNWFNIGVAVVAIAVAGGLVWMKLGPQLLNKANIAMVNGGASPSAETNPVAAGTNNAQQAAEAALAPSGDKTSTPGLLDNPDQFANLGTMPAPENTGDANPKAAPIADPFAGVPDKPTADAAAAAAPAPVPVQVPMPAPITSAPVPAQTVTTTKTETVMPEPVVPTPMETAPIAAVDSALATKVDALENRLNDMDSKLTAIQSAPAADSSRLNAIQSSLERLESRLDDMAINKASTRSASVSTEDEAVKRASTPKKSKPKKAVTPAPREEPAYRPEPVRAAPASSGSGGWELRGAQPGRAVLAKGSDIREVGVGETVPGLGEITGVAQINGQWVVQGTSGRLSQ